MYRKLKWAALAGAVLCGCATTAPVAKQRAFAGVGTVAADRPVQDPPAQADDGAARGEPDAAAAYAHVGG